ncbi:hypothetical protein GPALN_001796 [Globodera pallida]|nr:hypothetical protein GPALN_001796 [Globodera pallida]
MKLLIINVFFLLIALNAFAAAERNSSGVDHWNVCNVEKNGPIILENDCERLLLCYKSKFSTSQNSKVARRFRSKIGMNREGLFAECAEVMESEGWHALILGKMSDGKVAFESSLRFEGFFGNEFINETAKNTAIQIFSNADGLLEKDFEMELHLGAFMDDFDGMTLRVLALDLLSAIGQNGTEWCKMKKTLFEMNAITATTDTLDKSFICDQPHTSMLEAYLLPQCQDFRNEINNCCDNYDCVVSENGNLTDYSYVGNKTFFDFDCNQKFCKCLLEKLPAKAPKESPCLNHLYIICGEQQKAKGEIKVTTVTTATLGQKCYPGRLLNLDQKLMPYCQDFENELDNCCDDYKNPDFTWSSSQLRLYCDCGLKKVSARASTNGACFNHLYIMCAYFPYQQVVIFALSLFK